MPRVETSAFMDASCTKCGKRIGWYGLVVEQPACRRCGHKPDPVALERNQAAVNDFRELLEELRKADPKAGTWRRARLAAGLTLLKAARLLNVSPTELSLIEQGQASPIPMLAARMAACYSGEEP